MVEAWSSFEGVHGTVDGAEAVELVRATRAATIAAEDQKARMRWKLDETIAKQKAAKAAKKAAKGRSKKLVASASTSSSLSSTSKVGESVEPRIVGSRKRSRHDRLDNDGNAAKSRGKGRDSKRPRKESDPSVLFMQNAPSKGLTRKMVLDHIVLGKGLNSVIFLLNKHAEPYGRAVLGYESEQAASAVLESASNTSAPIELQGRTIKVVVSTVSIEAAREKNGKLMAKKKVERKVKLSFVPRGVRR